MNITEQQHQIVNKCRSSVTWFLRNFGKLKHPSAGILRFHPFSYQREAIKNFRTHRLNIFRKCRQCLASGSPIWGPDGPKPIEEIKIGDLIYSLNPQSGEIVSVPVLETFDNGERDCVRVETKSGHKLICTGDHNYFTYNGPVAADKLVGRRIIEISDNAKNIFISRNGGDVKSVSPVGVCRVYDLRVPPFDNYVADGAVVHNSGVSKISGAFATWFGMFHSNKTILIVSRTDNDAMSFLRDHVVFLFEHLPGWMRELWAPIKQNEHEIAWPNGSRVQSLTSHPDVLRSNASSLNIIDEAAFIQNMDTLWSGGWPTLQHGGCLHPESLVSFDSGMLEIGGLHIIQDPWQNISMGLITDDGNGIATKSYKNGLAKTRQLTTTDGHYIEASLSHKFRILNKNGLYEWKEVKDLEINDELVLSCKKHENGVLIDLNQSIFDQSNVGCRLCGCSYTKEEIQKVSKNDDGWCPSCITTQRMVKNQLKLLPDVLDEKLAEFLGIIWGDGFFDKHGRFGVSCDRSYVDFIDFIHSRMLYYGGKPRNEIKEDDWSVRCNNKALALLLTKNGFSKSSSNEITIPPLVLRSPQIVRCAFLRGYFETDGSISKTCITVSSSSIKMLRQVQTILLSLGIRSRVKYSARKHGFSDKPKYSLSLKTIRDVILFRKYIGFISNTKSTKLNGISEEHRIHRDRYENTVAIDSFYNASVGLPSKVRQSILTRKMKNNMPRHFVRSMVEKYGQLANTTLGYLALNDLFTDKLSNIVESQCETYDITEDIKNTYIANGFVSHNSVIVISTCVAPNTYIWTENGLCQIKDLAPDKYDGFEDGYYHADYKGPKILGINGLEMPSKFYKRPKEATRKLTLSGGYHLEASRIHKLPTVDSNIGQITTRFFADLHVGDILPIKHGQMVFGNKDDINYKDPNRTYTKNPKYFTVDKITPELSYLLGVIVAEGYVREQEIRICCGDKSVIDTCCAWNNLYWNRFERDGVHIACCYKPMLVRFFQHLGLKLLKAPFKEIPARLFSCSEPVIRSFLRGLFDGDGSAAKRYGVVCLSSTSFVLIEQVRQLLFNYGIICNLETREAGTTTFRRKNGDIKTYGTHKSYKLVISGNYTRVFYEKIGFGLGRKQERLDNKKSHDWSILMPPVVISLLKQLKDSTDLSISKMTKLGLAPNVLFGRNSLTKNRLIRFLDKIDYPDNEYYIRLKELVSYDDFMEIKEIAESESEVYDFTMPQTHTFIGNCTIQMNTSGLGNWYWATMTDAEAGLNSFNPIVINWWDMDWAIEYTDPITRQKKRIAPRDGIRKTASHEEETFGPYWSPWLQEQYDQLQSRGEAWKFKQEILADFVGSGNTVLAPEVIRHVSTTVQDPVQIIRGNQAYVHPVSGKSSYLNFDFGDKEEGLWIWRKPVLATPEKRRGGQVIEPGTPAHAYVMGVDIATGKGRDYSAIEVFDVNQLEQVAEFMARCLPRDLVLYIDRIGRWYNCALAVVERNNGGDTLIDSLRYDMMYPRIWRKKDINDKPVAPNSHRARALKVQPYGFSTSVASKPTLNKFLIDYISSKAGDGYGIYSSRLLKQLQTYVRKRDRAGRDTGKTEAEEGAGNFDDLVMATGLAFIGTSDAYILDSGNLLPFNANSDFKDIDGPTILSDKSTVELQREYAELGGPGLLMPMSLSPEEFPEASAVRQIEAFTFQLGAIPVGQQGPLVTPPKYFFKRK